MDNQIKVEKWGYSEIGDGKPLSFMPAAAPPWKQPVTKSNILSPIELSCAWLKAKAEEETAKTRRIEIEETLIVQLGVKTEGAQTHDLGEFKVTVTGVINRTLDKEVWESIKDKLPSEIRPVTYEPKLDIPGVKWLQENQPADYRILAQALTVKPGKTYIKITAINKETN